ncbi:MAG: hypothetical protein RLZ10_401 [Bacteroidota bacterium]|jgi:hypothetical protein
MKIRLTLFFLIPSILFSQVSYDRIAVTVSFKCKYCNNEAAAYAVATIKNVSDFKVLDCIFMYESNEEVKSQDKLDALKYGYVKCTSALNKTYRCVNGLKITDEVKIERITRYCKVEETLDLWNKNFDEFCAKHPRFSSYFEKNDFNKFKEYRLKKEKIDSENRLKEQKIEQDKLEKEKDIFNREQDKLDNLISIQEFEKAALFYSELKNKGRFYSDSRLIKQKDSIQSGLNSLSSGIITLEAKELTSIILNNKAFFIELLNDSPKTIEIIFDQNGIGYINEVESKIKCTPKIEKVIHGFNVYSRAKGDFNLTIEQIQNPKKMYYDIWVAPNIKVQKSNDKYYKKTWLTASLLNDNIQVINDERVPKGKYWKVEHVLKHYRANGESLKTEELMIKNSENKLSKRLGVKISRSVFWVTSLSWLTLRYIEYSTVK